VIALVHFFKEDLIYLALILLFNVFIAFRIGIAAIRAIVFPFSLWIISDGFTGSSSLRYATDFAALLEKSYVILRLPNGKAAPTLAAASKGPKLGEPGTGHELEDRAILLTLKSIKDAHHFKGVKTNYTTREANTKLKSAGDLVSLYVETNQRVITKLKSEKKMS